MGILTGVVIYRRSQMQRLHFHGYCGVPYDSDDSDNKEVLEMLNQKLREFANDLDNL